MEAFANIRENGSRIGYGVVLTRVAAGVGDIHQQAVGQEEILTDVVVQVSGRVGGQMLDMG